jgi:hypothetical protein
MTKTSCNDHRKVGYAYRWPAGATGSVLACRSCGLPPEEHETLKETVTRLAAEWEKEHGPA